MIEPMEFIKYDKISDDVFILGSNVILRFNVSLSKTTSEGKRYHFYKEYEYPSKAHHQDTVITVKRSYDYYLSIENVQKNKSGDDKIFIRIGTQDYCKFKSQVDTAVSWFMDKKFKNLYVKSRGKLSLTSPIPECVIGGYPQNKFLRFIPAIIDRGEGKDKMEQGVEIDLSDYDNYILINVDRLMSLQFFLSTFNMYMAGQMLVNYLGIPYGLNRYTIGGTNNSKVLKIENDSKSIESVNGRTIGKKKNISSLE